MKKYLGYLILGLALLVSIIINGFQFISNDDNNIYECSKIAREDDYEMIETVIIEYDKIGRIISENIKYVEKFNDDNEYKLIKESRMSVKENNYRYNDKENSIIDEYNLDFTIDENNNEQFTWVKYILDNYNDKEYACKTIKK